MRPIPGRAALLKLTEASEPATGGTELTVRQIEEENERKESLIQQVIYAAPTYPP